MPRSGRFIPGEENLYPWYSKRADFRACLDGCEKSSLSAGFDPWIVHTVASSYTELLTYNNDHDYDDDNYNNKK